MEEGLKGGSSYCRGSCDARSGSYRRPSLESQAPPSTSSGTVRSVLPRAPLPSSIPRAASFVKVEGFTAGVASQGEGGAWAAAPSTPLPISPRGGGAAASSPSPPHVLASLLTRQLSLSAGRSPDSLLFPQLATRGGPAAAPAGTPGGSESAAAPRPAPARPSAPPPRDLLARHAARWPAFAAPVVQRAWTAAAAALEVEALLLAADAAACLAALGAAPAIVAAALLHAAPRGVVDAAGAEVAETAGLEDAAFGALAPRAAGALASTLAAAQAPAALCALRAELAALLARADVRTLEIAARPKHLAGVAGKMAARGLADARLVADARGLRVVVDGGKDACYRALAAVQRAWGEAAPHKDYVRSPKPNGYRSLHAILHAPGGGLVEVQVRSAKMHFLAEYGTGTAHWQYKEGGKGLSRRRQEARPPRRACIRGLLGQLASSPTPHVASPRSFWGLDGAVASNSCPPLPSARPQGSPPSPPLDARFEAYLLASGQKPVPPAPERVLVEAGTTLARLAKSLGGRVTVTRGGLALNSAAGLRLCMGDMVRLVQTTAPAPVVSNPTLPQPEPLAAPPRSSNTVVPFPFPTTLPRVATTPSTAVAAA
ncbi:GTP pyrophosphokinase [Auxenochlorella protothecoides]|uniref:GTP pyrophosphokinase n=1 Tax=Auxenochlorella protothecoides TaxID=3075 RepID=A0A087SDJ4_AUXPR|nr:GTP pyrophosphokinase [Auxenochlorella protothecoides]KFM23798.1 GTP pyrophosphokinase [Auxenochlorella protothecoides]